MCAYKLNPNKQAKKQQQNNKTTKNLGQLNTSKHLNVTIPSFQIVIELNSILQSEDTFHCQNMKHFTLLCLLC